MDNPDSAGATAGSELHFQPLDGAGQRQDGKVAIVTGASANLGRIFAEQLGADGARVVVHYNSAAKTGEARTAVATPTYGGYAGSKSPVEHFTNSLAKEVGHRGITANCIAPGPLKSSFFYPAETDENLAWLKSMSINGDMGEPTDICR